MGSSISHFDITLDDDDQGYGRHELLPILAGSTIRGKVQFDLTSPLRLPRLLQQSSPTSIANNDPIQQQQQQQHNHPVLLLRMYGKEKVRLDSSKAQRIRSSTGNSASGSSTGTKTASSFSSSSSYVAEREFLSIPIRWDSFPINSTTNHSDTNTTVPNKQSRNTNTIPVGTYSFPFHIQLPKSIPSSTYYPHHDDRSRSRLYFRIQYKIMAAIYIPTKSQQLTLSKIELLKPNYKTVRYLWIAAVSDPTRIPREPVPCMVQPMAMELRNPLFFQKGIFMFGASIENTRLFHQTSTTNEPLQLALHVSCRNDSSIHIQNVQISIIEKLIWNTVPTVSVDPKTGIVTTSTAYQQIQHIPVIVLDHVQLPGLYKESKGFIKSMMEGMLGTATQNLQRQVYNDLISGENLVPITIPSGNINNSSAATHHPLSDNSYHGKNGKRNSNFPLLRNTLTLRESYQGQLIQISHYVKIVFQTGTFCKTPTLEIPIQILPTPVDVEAAMITSSNNQHAASSSISSSGITGAGVATYQPPPGSTTTTKHKIPSPLPSNVASSTAPTTMLGGMDGPITIATVEDTAATASSNNTIPNPDYIPMATAVIIPTISRNPSSSSRRHHHQQRYEADEATSDIIVLGGDAILQQQQQQQQSSVSRRGFFNNRRRPGIGSPIPTSSISTSNGPTSNEVNTSTTTTSTTKLSSLVPLSAPALLHENTISIPALLSSMRTSMVDHYEYIQGKLCDPLWTELFHNMSSYEYGSIIANVHEFDQPRVAYLLAPFVNHKNGGCNCVYAASAIRHTSDHHRTITAQKLIPLCIDIRTNHTIILDELSGWEQTITESVFTEAMNN